MNVSACIALAATHTIIIGNSSSGNNNKQSISTNWTKFKGSRSTKNACNAQRVYSLQSVIIRLSYSQLSQIVPSFSTNLWAPTICIEKSKPYNSSHTFEQSPSNLMPYRARMHAHTTTHTHTHALLYNMLECYKNHLMNRFIVYIYASFGKRCDSCIASEKSDRIVEFGVVERKCS